MTLAMPVHNLPVVDDTLDSLITVPELNAPRGQSHHIQDAANVAIHIPLLNLPEGCDCE